MAGKLTKITDEKGSTMPKIFRVTVTISDVVQAEFYVECEQSDSVDEDCSFYLTGFLTRIEEVRVTSCAEFNKAIREALKRL